MLPWAASSGCETETYGSRVFGARENRGVLPFLFPVKVTFWLAFCSLFFPPISANKDCGDQSACYNRAQVGDHSREKVKAGISGHERLFRATSGLRLGVSALWSSAPSGIL